MEDFRFNIDGQTVLHILLKYWLIILISAVFGGVLGWFFNKWVFTPVYESTKTVFAWESNDSETKNLVAKIQDIDANTRLVNDYKEIITSRKVQKEVAELVKKKFSTDQFKYRVNSDLQRNTRIIRITAYCSNPAVAQFVADATADVFIKTVQEIMNLRNIKIIDVAELPENPVKPRLLINIIVGIMLGLLGAIAVSAAKELLDWTIKIPEEIQERLNKNVIGTIPEADPLPGNKTETNNQQKNVARIFVSEKKNSAIVEAFKMLRTNIEFSIPGKKKSKVIMFTSALPGEGKTTIVTNLALSMCESGKKAVLLDCDLRKPRLHNFFKVDNSHGVVSFLVGKASIKEVVHKNVFKSGLDLISSGPIPPNPTELLMSDAYKQLLSELSLSYDYVFIDSPPTLNMADTAIIGSLVDATMLVIIAGKTRIELIKRCIRQLHQTNIEISGILLNRFNIETIKYNYYYKYHYHADYSSITDNKLDHEEDAKIS
jgi:capsular exopolysaccharide synthesis family protein